MIVILHCRNAMVADGMQGPDDLIGGRKSCPRHLDHCFNGAPASLASL